MTFEYSPAEVRKVKRVQFGILSPDEIRAMSVCEILSPQTFDNGGIPKEVKIIFLNQLSIIQSLHSFIHIISKNKNNRTLH